MLGQGSRGAAKGTAGLFGLASSGCTVGPFRLAAALRAIPVCLGSRQISARTFAAAPVESSEAAAPIGQEQEYADMIDPATSPLHAVCSQVASARKADGLHEPVMPVAALQAWVPAHVAPDGEGAVFVDTTIGHAGHSEALLRAYPKARLIGLDADGEMVGKALKALKAAGVSERAQVIKAPFSHLREVLDEAGVHSVDGVLADIGFNSGHVSNAARGFAFRKDGRLDGRFDTVSHVSLPVQCYRHKEIPNVQSIPGSTSIADIVNKCSFGQLVSLLRHKGGETQHERAIARAIVEWRGKGARKRRIASTLELRFVVESAVAVALGGAPVASSRADARFAQRQAKQKNTEFKRKGRMQGVWDRESVWITKSDQDKMVSEGAALMCALCCSYCQNTLIIVFPVKEACSHQASVHT